MRISEHCPRRSNSWKKFFTTTTKTTIAVIVIIILLAMPQRVTPYSEIDGGDPSLDNWFNIFDKDGNEVIDKDEYAIGMKNFETVLKKAQASAASTEDTANKKSRVSSSIKEDDIGLGFWSAFMNSFSMIIATEIGDKTFFIAAIMSMKCDRSAVFSGAILALICMTILSSFMGLVLPTLIPRQYTHYIAALLFLYFGFKLLYDSRQMQSGKCSDELEEVEEELLHKTSNKKEDDENIEEGTGSTTEGNEASKVQKKKVNGSNDWEKVFIQSLTMTFLAEWGDRSQIATIALAAAKDPYGVNVGGILGHSLCTGMAVWGGRLLATKLEERTVSSASGVIFLLFGLHSLFFEEV